MRKFSIALSLLASGVIAMAAVMPPVGGGAYSDHLPSDQMSDQQREAIKDEIQKNVDSLRRQGKLAERQAGTVLYDWPIKAATGLNDAGFHGISNFVDQDPTYPNALLDYNCGARTYDLNSGYNHAGIDFFTWPYPWNKMDSDLVEVIAIADGIIVNKADGNFDRNCGFGNGNWNAVFIQHADDSIAWYGHLKNGSVIDKNIGDTVSSGEVLGIVGSSGNSTGPHLHLEVYDAEGNLMEPYAGVCNSLNASTLWVDQREYYDSALNTLRTASAPPDFGSCPNPEVSNTRRAFVPGELIRLVAFYRDQLNSQISDYRVRAPNGSLLFAWQHNSSASHFAASWWYWEVNLTGQPLGTWTFEVDYLGNTSIQEFELVSSADSDNDGVLDHLDNCMSESNPSQLDSNGDGYGNACDADLNNDGIINFIDVSAFVAVFLGSDDDADFNGDGNVNFLDFSVIQSGFLSPPGPSAYSP